MKEISPKTKGIDKVRLTRHKEIFLRKDKVLHAKAAFKTKAY